MKLLHLSDLHLGIRVNEYSLIEDQRYILNAILEIAQQERVDTIIIAGDIYDKAVPSGEAVELFDDFLTKIVRLRIPTFISAGNHDSAQRLCFGANIMSAEGIYISPVFTGEIIPVRIHDNFGPINIYCFPYMRHNKVIEFMEGVTINTEERNILVAHQFVTGAQKCDSEEITIGGVDNIDAAVFAGFDYVALGHLHRPQNISAENKIRYCGTPLKYSFSEVNDIKSVTVIEMAEKGNIQIDTIPLTPMRDMKEIKGTYNQLMSYDYYKDTTYTDDYMHITLTDEEDIPDAIGRLRTVYTNLMRLDYDNIRTRNSNIIEADCKIQEKTPNELFGDFYKLQNNRDMTDEQQTFVSEIIAKIWEEDI